MIDFALLQELTNDELQTVITWCQQIITQRQQTFTYLFEEAADTRKAAQEGKKTIPYVARLSWDSTNQRIERHFFPLQRKTQGQHEILVRGEYTARGGDILEIERAGTWKHKQRDLYLVASDGMQIHLCHYQDASAVFIIEDYLRGQVQTTEALLAALGRNIPGQADAAKNSENPTRDE